MKFSVLSGAIKNAGDFLIVERSVQLLKYVFPECEIRLYQRNYNLDEHLKEINKSEALIFAGGPVFSNDVYPKLIPLVPDLNKITTKFFSIGLGWYGKNNLDSTVYENYKFNAETFELVRRMNEDNVISCRDWYTVRLLKNQGFSNIKMTGCPAWYDLGEINKTSLRKEIEFTYKKICISDPGYTINIERSYKIVKYVKKKFPQAQINYIFHRGILQDENTQEKRAKKNVELTEKLRVLGINIYDISYSAKGFSIYDDCDLHIGFRVHAHIYNISKRNISILFEEDGRGSGANEALGLYGIKPYFYELDGKTKEVILHNNPYYLENLDDYLFMLKNSNFKLMEHAYEIQKKYFTIMIEHLKLISKI